MSPDFFIMHIACAKSNMGADKTGKIRGAVRMTEKRKSIAAIVLIIAAAIGIVVVFQYLGIGTISSSWRIGYVDNAGKHHWSAQYVQFDGTMKRTMYADNGVNNLHIEATIEKGTLGVTIKDVQGEVIFSQSELQNQSLEIETPDKVIVELAGEKHKGSFSMRYQPVPPLEPLKPEERIFLYGQQKDTETLLEQEFKLWEKYYTQDGMRHLFLELPYYTAEFLNAWMQAPNNDILNALYKDWDGTAAHSEPVRLFYHKIKERCPETVFHGTDIGHEYATTGKRYLTYLEQNGMKDTKSYDLTLDAIEQGKRYYESGDESYRATMMYKNFRSMFDKLKGNVNVMGIYDSVHLSGKVVDLEGAAKPCMAEQLKERYGTSVHTEVNIKPQLASIRTDPIQAGGKTYDALYLGVADLSSTTPEFQYRAFWRLENAYEDFKNYKTTGNVLPYHSFPMHLEKGQVIVVDYVKADGTTIRQYYRTSGNNWYGQSAAEEVTFE